MLFAKKIMTGEEMLEKIETQETEAAPTVARAEAQATPAAQEAEVGTSVWVGLPNWTLPPGAAMIRLNAEIIAASAPAHDYMALYEAMIAELSSEGEMGEEVAETISHFKGELKEPPGVVEIDFTKIRHLSPDHKEDLRVGIVLAILATYRQAS
jgi:hypothetical protein